MENLSAVESIFFAALEKASPEERAAYLDQACGKEGELRQHVERLLSAHPKVGGFPPGRPRSMSRPSRSGPARSSARTS